MVDWYILPPIDQICFNCPLPQCDDNNPSCPRRQALAAGNVSRVKPALREVQVLDYLHKSNSWHRIIDIASTTDIPYKTIFNVLRKLWVKGKVARTGKGHTRRWKAKCTNVRSSQ